MSAESNVLDLLARRHELPEDLPPLPPIEAYVDADHDSRTAHANPVSPWTEKATPAAFTGAQLLAPIEPERYVFPGIVPTEAYTVVAGPLGAAKSTLLRAMMLSRASGFDLLDLAGESGGPDIGPCVLIVYEDSDSRIVRSFQIQVQHFHQEIARAHGAKAAAEFISRIEKNLRRVTLTGEACAGIVTRLNGAITENHGFVEHLLREVGKFASSELMIGLDPLRLAMAGSQNDDDGADVAVHALNRIANYFPDSGFVVASHTTKGAATNRDAPDTMESASYATSGSALYSQHARSNLLLTRMKPEAMRTEFPAGTFTDEEITKQLATCLTHGRLSHGTAGDKRYFAMRGGVLIPTDRVIGSQTAADRAKQGLPAIHAAIESLKGSGVTVISRNALESDTSLRDSMGGRSGMRSFFALAIEQGWLAESGEGKAKRIEVTDSGRNFAGLNGEVR